MRQPNLESLAILRITDLRFSDWEHLIEASESEGYRFIRRLADEWESGVCRFDGVGEALFGASIEAQLIGVAGLTVDPFALDRKVGRLRRVYVLPEARGAGLGRTLVRRVLADALGAFRCIRLRVENPVARTLYESLGFEPVEEPETTHRLMLCPGEAEG